MKVLIGLVLGVAVLSAAPRAQDTPAPAPKVAESKPVAPQEAAALQAQRLRIAGLLEAQAVLQKEIDAAVAEFQRAVQRLQAAAPAGMELAPDGASYVPAKKKDEPKKDPPTM